MSYFETFHGFHQPYFSLNLVRFGRNPFFETYSQNPNNYTNTHQFFFQDFNPQISRTEPNCTNSRFKSLKNSAQSYINAFYSHIYPSLVNYSSRTTEKKNENESETETSDSESFTERVPTRCRSFENLINITKNKILGRHRRSLSTDSTIYRDENFDTSPHTINIRHINRSYNHLNNEENVEIPVKNILLPEVVINNVRYNRPEAALRNFSNLINSGPEPSINKI